MFVAHQINPLKRHLRAIQAQGLRIGFVPTMGALHDGHLALVDYARKHSEVIVASIFVNPKQFGPTEDLAKYPRTFEADRARLERSDVDVLFAPTVDEMYPPGFETIVDAPTTSSGLCGAVRPGHFRGVATVVARLLGIVRPDVAVFGEKDFQQLAVIRRLTQDLGLDVEILGHPIVRDPDGLAMSSRNQYLSPDDRVRALALSRGLDRAQQAYDAGERSEPRLVATLCSTLSEVGIEPEYAELRAFDLGPFAADGPCVLLVAARVGSTRLIDNRILRRP